MNPYTSDNMKKYRKKRRTTIGIGIAILILIVGFIGYETFFTQSGQRRLKDLKSEYTGGLNRTVTVYDNNGEVIKSWEGRIDVQENSYGNKVLFDLDGKRKVVYNAVVIVEEE